MVYNSSELDLIKLLPNKVYSVTADDIIDAYGWRVYDDLVGSASLFGTNDKDIVSHSILDILQPYLLYSSNIKLVKQLTSLDLNITSDARQLNFRKSMKLDLDVVCSIHPDVTAYLTQLDKSNITNVNQLNKKEII